MARQDPRRNDPCPCGSGRKFKRCHMQSERAAAAKERRRQVIRKLQGHFAICDSFPPTPADFTPEE